MKHHFNGEEQVHLRNWSNGKEKDTSGRDGGLVNHGRDGFDKLGTELKRYATFYFTNFPHQLSKFLLCKGFEVCGMLEDVFVPMKRNKCGESFGFAKFSNVRNVSKLLSALNNVYFGHYRVRARIASFNCNDRMEESRPETGRHGLMKDNGKLDRKEGNVVVSQSLDLKRNGLRKDTKALQASRGDVNDIEPVKGDTGEPEAVRVGDVEVSLGARKDQVRRHNVKVHEGGYKPMNTALSNVAIKEKDHQVFIKSYRAEPDDVS
ncbi:RNA recognition motif [Trifolium pratense]|uniref:RNA recognition motif n=1 Tax=Trifolium pratense TaxID=57577 RepID=A0A2K3MMW0_TRIPR|nr:RNA recognition motif [Trifolium pratense]